MAHPQPGVSWAGGSGLANTQGDDSDSRVSMGTQARGKCAPKSTPRLEFSNFVYNVHERTMIRIHCNFESESTSD